MEIGDTVVRKSYNKDITFKIVDLRETEEGRVYVLKGINLRILADSYVDDLELVSKDNIGELDKIFDKKINTTIKKVLMSRAGSQGKYRTVKSKDETFGRPGKVLHIDADPEYLKACLKVYKQLAIEAEGRLILEKDQSDAVVELVKALRPDIVVLTGHDGMIKGAKNYLDLRNYKNSQRFVDSVIKLRSYEPDYDDLVIFAGACQSCYEAILEAGANFASSPNRVLIHCLDPVFVCEKIAFTNFEKVVPIQEVIENTITGIKGVGGLQTKGKYREGYPKSQYA